MMCNGDLLDDYCDSEFGHTDWSMTFDDDGNMICTFFKNARPEYLEELQNELEEEDDGDE